MFLFDVESAKIHEIVSNTKQKMKGMECWRGQKKCLSFVLIKWYMYVEGVETSNKNIQ